MTTSVWVNGRGGVHGGASPVTKADWWARPRADDGEAGSATIWVLAAMVLVLACALLGVALGAAVLARHRAESAADLAALAGADRSAVGATDGCARAAAIATANGGRLSQCQVLGADVLVVVSVPASGLPAGLGRASASARAGPMDELGTNPR